MNIENALSSLGFGKNEQAVYLSLLSLGKARSSDLIADTGIHRHLVYQSLDKLIERKLIQKHKKGKRSLYIAQDPQRLVDEIDAQKYLAESVVKQLRHVSKDIHRDITVYEGDTGTKEALKKTLHAEQEEPLYIIGASEQRNNERLVQSHWRMLGKETREQYLLCDRSVSRTSLIKQQEEEGTLARYLPMDINTPLWLSATGNQALISLLDDDPIALHIQSPAIAEAFRNYFQHLWEQPVRVFQGEKSYERAFQDILDTLEAGERLDVMGIFTFDPEFANFIHQFHAKRSRRGIEARILLNQQARERMGALADLKRTEVKYLAEGVVTPAVFLLYGSKTLISLPNQRLYLQLDNAEATTAFRSYFESLWEPKQHIAKGEHAWQMLEDLLTQTNEEVYLLGDTSLIVAANEKAFATWNAARIQTNCSAQILLSNENSHTPLDELFLAKVQRKNVLIPEGQAIWVFGNVVCFLRMEEGELFVRVIEDEVMGEGYTLSFANDKV